MPRPTARASEEWLGEMKRKSRWGLGTWQYLADPCKQTALGLLWPLIGLDMWKLLLPTERTACLPGCLVVTTQPQGKKEIRACWAEGGEWKPRNPTQRWRMEWCRAQWTDTTSQWFLLWDVYCFWFRFVLILSSVREWFRNPHLLNLQSAVTKFFILKILTAHH